MAVTLKDIAHASGVSWQVVATVLAGKGSARASEDTRQRVRRIAEEMGYRPHGPARSLATGRTRTIEVQFHSTGAERYHIPQHYLPTWAATVQYCQSHKYNVLMRTSTDLQGEGLVRNIEARNIDAVLLMGVSDEQQPRAPREAGLPHGCVNPALSADDLAAKGYIVSNFDNVRGVEAAIDYLYHLGHRKIGYVRFLNDPVHRQMGPARSGPVHSDFQERWTGYRNALAGHGLPLRNDWVWDEMPWIEGGEQAAKRFLELPERPTAILTSNDLQALGMLRFFQARGISVPGDLSLVGFDDIQAASYVWPELTTVRLDWYGLAESAVTRLFESLLPPADSNAGRETVSTIPLSGVPYRYPVELIVRGSCVPLP